MTGRTELLAVSSRDGSTVDDPGGVGDRLGDSLGEVGSDVLVRVLGLLRGRDVAGSDRPDRLVGDNDVAAGEMEEEDGDVRQL